jgi:hypothetical protein
MPPPKFLENFVGVCIIVAPILNTALLLTTGKSWLSLYIQRRKLEEQAKIERLLSGSDRCRDFYSDEIHHEN